VKRYQEELDQSDHFIRALKTIHKVTDIKLSKSRFSSEAKSLIQPDIEEEEEEKFEEEKEEPKSGLGPIEQYLGEEEPENLLAEDKPLTGLDKMKAKVLGSKKPKMGMGEIVTSPGKTERMRLMAIEKQREI